MPRPRLHHMCTACGAVASKWTGRCSGCGEWNTLVERQGPPSDRTGPRDRRTEPGSGLALEGRLESRGSDLGGRGWLPPSGSAGLRPVPLLSVDPDAARPFPTGLSELDRVLSGGLVPGSVTLLAGEPGIGKSTLVLQAVSSVAARGANALVVAAEESAEQVSRRAKRLRSICDQIFLVSTSDLLAAIEASDQVAPELLVIDSIQAISDPAIGSPAGSPNQVRECAQLLAQYAKATGTATILVGHVTKDGSLAGPRTLEHLVDTVLTFEGDRHHALRALVATKHRYGASGELGLFEMDEGGLSSVEDPSALLLCDRRPDAPGTVALPIVEGRRPLLVEVQALVSETRSPSPRRVVQGMSAGRVALLLAVLERSCRAPVAGADVFVSTVGGIKVAEPAGDLAVAVALASAIAGVPLPPDAVVFGEVGLAGEVRQVSRPERRLAEAARLGFTRAIVPVATPGVSEAIRPQRVASLVEALALLGLADGLSQRGRASAGVSTDERKSAKSCHN